MSDDSIEAKLARLEELEQHFAEAVERAKLEAMKELAYGAGHEINNPLANIATRAQTLLHEETDPEKRRKLAAINAQAFRAHEMIADLMLFARAPQLRLSMGGLCRLLWITMLRLVTSAAADTADSALRTGRVGLMHTHRGSSYGSAVKSLGRIVGRTSEFVRAVFSRRPVSAVWCWTKSAG